MLGPVTYTLPGIASALDPALSYTHKITVSKQSRFNSLGCSSSSNWTSCQSELTLSSLVTLSGTDIDGYSLTIPAGVEDASLAGQYFVSHFIAVDGSTVGM